MMIGHCFGALDVVFQSPLPCLGSNSIRMALRPRVNCLSTLSVVYVLTYLPLLICWCLDLALDVGSHYLHVIHIPDHVSVTELLDFGQCFSTRCCCCLM